MNLTYGTWNGREASTLDTGRSAVCPIMSHMTAGGVEKYPVRITQFDTRRPKVTVGSTLSKYEAADVQGDIKDASAGAFYNTTMQSADHQWRDITYDSPKSVIPYDMERMAKRHGC